MADNGTNQIFAWLRQMDALRVGIAAWLAIGLARLYRLVRVFERARPALKESPMDAQETRERTFSAIILVVAAAVALVFGCGPNLAVSDFRSHYQPRTRVVAIAPLANESGNPEGTAAGQAIREAIFHELIKRRDKYTVTIQSISETDQRIRDSGRSDSSVSRLGGIDLCRLTGADAVMKGSVTRYVKLGAGDTFARYSDALFGLVTSEVRVDVAIFDGTDGKLVFQHHIDKSGDLVHEREALLSKVGSALAAKFPYTK